MPVALPDDVRVQTRQQLIDQELAFWQHSTPIGFIFGLGTVMGFIVGVVICYQILYSDVDDHMAEFATLKAIGYHNSYFVSVVLQESLWLSAFGFVPGIVVAVGLVRSARLADRIAAESDGAARAGRAAVDIGHVHRLGLPGARRVFQADPAELF